MNKITENINNSLLKIEQTAPVVHHITNFVTINDCANVSTALGASPVMAYSHYECAQITEVSNALVLNTGTPDKMRFKAAVLSGKCANTNGIPIILDPVGAGAVAFRQNGIFDILKNVRPSVIKGNSAEIKTLAGLSNISNKCIDSAENQIDMEIVKELAAELKTVIAVTGQKDIITDGLRTVSISRGTNMFTRISGAGCMASSVIGAFLSVNKEPFNAAVQAIFLVDACGENAAEISRGPADFKVNFINALYLFRNTGTDEGGIVFEQG